MRTSSSARGVLVVVGTVAAALVGWAVAHPLLGVDLSVGHGAAAHPVGPGAVAVVSLLAGLLGWATLALSRRLTRRGDRVWRVVASVVLLISLLGPLGGTTPAAVLSLLVLHLVVGLLLIVTLPPRPDGRSSIDA